MKKNAVMFFLKSLLKSILVIVSILAVGAISYKVSYEYLSKQLEAGKLDVQEKELETILDQAKTDEISKNLIYVVDDKQRITHMLLEICNTKTYNMDYVTIPVETDYTIPARMYQKLCVVDEEIPQIVRFSKLRKYFADLEDTQAYGYAELIMEKLLKTDISYFTVIPQDIYDLHYQEQKMTTQYSKVQSGTSQQPATSPEASATPQNYSASVTMKVSVLSESYINQLNDLGDDEAKIMAYIKEQYKQDGVSTKTISANTAPSRSSKTASSAATWCACAWSSSDRTCRQPPQGAPPIKSEDAGATPIGRPSEPCMVSCPYVRAWCACAWSSPDRSCRQGQKTCGRNPARQTNSDASFCFVRKSYEESPNNRTGLHSFRTSHVPGPLSQRRPAGQSSYKKQGRRYNPYSRPCEPFTVVFPTPKPVPCPNG